MNALQHPTSIAESLPVLVALVTFPLRYWSASGSASSPGCRPAAITYLESQPSSPKRKAA